MLDSDDIDHPDFDLLEEIARGLDNESRRNRDANIGPQEIFSEVCDPDSFREHAIRRVETFLIGENPAMILRIALGDPSALDAIATGASLFLAGAVTAARFKKAVHKAEVDARVQKALDFIADAVHTDGAHHLQWYLDQIAQALAGPQYEVWRDGLADRNEGVDYDAGIAP
jgi:hypothetical protein